MRGSARAGNSAINDLIRPGHSNPLKNISRNNIFLFAWTPVNKERPLCLANSHMHESNVASYVSHKLRIIDFR